MLKKSQTFYIDHYLGKELVMNLLVLRFANVCFGAVWNRQHIKSVQVIFKEKIGAEGRAGYFDQYGIIRDVMQNHLLQMVALVAMEQPLNLTAEHIRQEKLKGPQRVQTDTIGGCVYRAGKREREHGTAAATHGKPQAHTRSDTALPSFFPCLYSMTATVTMMASLIRAHVQRPLPLRSFMSTIQDGMGCHLYSKRVKR